MTVSGKRRVEEAAARTRHERDPVHLGLRHDAELDQLQEALNNTRSELAQVRANSADCAGVSWERKREIERLEAANGALQRRLLTTEETAARQGRVLRRYSKRIGELIVEKGLLKQDARELAEQLNEAETTAARALVRADGHAQNTYRERRTAYRQRQEAAMTITDLREEVADLTAKLEERDRALADVEGELQDLRETT